MSWVNFRSNKQVTPGVFSRSSISKSTLLLETLGAVPFNIVHGSGVTATKLGLEGEGCQLEIYVEKTMGGGGSSAEI